MKKILIVLSFVSLVSCSNQKYIYTINYAKTMEDYYVQVTSESITLSKQDSTKAINKFKNTTGSERRDLQIQQIYTTQRTVPSKKLYKRKPRNNKYESN